MLNDRELGVIDKHIRLAGVSKKARVHQWDRSYSVFNPATGRLHVHKGDRRKSAEQQYVFESSNAICNTLTAAHRLKFWDLRRCATDRELARVQGFPESFALPSSCANKLFGGAVSVPVAAYAIDSILEGATGAAPATFVDVCSGIGGFHVAAHSKGLTCVGASEVFSAALKSYQLNFPDTPMLGCLYSAAWPRCDMVLMGFPCQSFSRSMQSFDRNVHPSRKVWQQLGKILDDTGAGYVVLENVRSILKLGVAQLSCILELLDDRGFFVEWEILDSKEFGLPQTRKRWYLIARKCSSPAFLKRDGEGETRRVLKDVLTLCDEDGKGARNYVNESD